MELFSSNQALILFLQLLRRFRMLFIHQNAIYRTDLLALRLIIVAYALSTQIGIDFINFFALVNSIIRAFRLANIAVNALIGNKQRHLLFPSIKHNKPDIVTVSGLIGKLFAEAQL